MEWVIISLFSFSAILLLLSFFQKNETKEMEKQLETTSIQLMKEIYYLKKKVKVLEEEYMITDTNLYSDSNENSKRSLCRDDVLSMHEEGHSVEDIAMMTENSVDKIEELLAQ
ncbi:hypothetical protein [Salipaludibacillus daqingensis]|uniref:hypothetical protein n=1 Tax=Salipaludibacillus daqingensis TaxID=3041001 RepID=UPI0024750C3D|nr:hypothetical protein [Salipaludibacillus daqingensis]